MFDIKIELSNKKNGYRKFYIDHLQNFKLYKCNKDRAEITKYVIYSGILNDSVFSLIIIRERVSQLNQNKYFINLTLVILTEK